MVALLTPSPSATLATDTQSLAALRSRAAADPKSAVREAARQLETLFMNELMKSMRATTLATPGGEGDSGAGGAGGASGALGTEMLDAHYASQMSGLPGGLSEAIVRHLERQMGISPGPIPATGSANNVPAPLSGGVTRLPQKGAAGFVAQHQAAAQAAQEKTGIPATFMIAQAAHETGWGRKEIRHADGSASHNLFGIKAGAGWRGPVAEVTTTEYVNGEPRKVVAKFRAYASHAESFADYARLMKDSPRYAGVVQGVAGGSVAKAGSAGTAGGAGNSGTAAQAATFAQGLQRAGYATDPAYADKLTRVINTTLRLQRSLVA